MKQKLTEYLDEILDAIQSIILSFLVKLGPFFVALMPALFISYAIFYTFKDEAGKNLALFFAVVVGLAMETVGIVATHTAINLYNAKEAGMIQPVKFRVMAWLVPVYVLGVAFVVGFSQDAFTPLVKGLGVASPFLTTIVYVAVALARDIIRIEANQEAVQERQNQIEAEERERRNQIEAEQREWQREKERLEMTQRHEERLAKIETKKPAIFAQNQPQKGAGDAQNGHFSPPLHVPKSAWRMQALDILRENPHIKGAQLGRQLGASERTGQNILNELEQAGLVHRNGQGIVIVNQ